MNPDALGDINAAAAANLARRAAAHAEQPHSAQDPELSVKHLGVPAVAAGPDRKLLVIIALGGLGLGVLVTVLAFVLFQ